MTQTKHFDRECISRLVLVSFTQLNKPYYLHIAFNYLAVISELHVNPNYNTSKIVLARSIELKPDFLKVGQKTSSHPLLLDTVIHNSILHADAFTP